jgi:hypothetical protein
MDGTSLHQLSGWISLIVGCGIGVATAIGLSLWVTFHKPSKPSA